MGIEEFKYRLKSIVDKEPSVNAFAKKCECTEGALRSYLAGKSMPGLDKLVSIAKAGRVSLEWLAIGADPKVCDPSYMYAMFGSDTELQEIVDLLQKHVPDQKGNVLRVLRAKKSLKDALKAMGEIESDWF